MSRALSLRLSPDEIFFWDASMPPELHGYFYPGVYDQPERETDLSFLSSNMRGLLMNDLSPPKQ